MPKTIDNDVGDTEFKLIDHTPGYGSVARYWALNVQNANEENAGSSPADPVLVMQAMGRKIGFIPAAARLADPNRELPLLIVLTESGLTMPELADKVNDLLKTRGRAMVVVSEGFEVGDIGARQGQLRPYRVRRERDAGRAGGDQLPEPRGLPVHGSARTNIPGTGSAPRHDLRLDG